MFGILNVHKPAGVTSRRVVDQVQRLVRPAKAGHAGTLDPLAVGVLVVCVGPATRLIEYVQRMPKRYTGAFLLGRESPTEDIEGEVTELVDPPRPSRSDIETACQPLVGEIMQRPPAFSALKVSGKRAYALARAGEQVELKPRKITVLGVEVVSYDYPELVLDIRCGSGTYVRSLGRDLAESLGTAAVMSALTRTAVGRFGLEEAVIPEQITKENLSQFLQPALCAVEDLPRIELTDEERVEFSHGRSIEREMPSEATEAVAVDHDGHLVALVAERSPGQLRPVRNFPRPA